MKHFLPGNSNLYNLKAAMDLTIGLFIHDLLP
jgi:hypothetical protein